MTLREVVKQLQGQGVPVSFRVRPDYSIVITQIGTQKYSGRSGNIAARNITGAQMSTREVLQRTTASAAKIPNAKYIPLSPAVNRALRAAQKAYRESGMTAGKPTRVNIRGAMKEGLTEEQILESLRRSKQYAKGIAYDERVIAIRDRIRVLAAKFDEAREILFATADQIDNLLATKRHRITSDQVETAADIIYQIETDLNFENDTEAMEEASQLANFIGTWK